MEKSEYEEKMIDMLSDVTTYKNVSKDPTPSMERRMNALLFAMRKQNKLGKELYNRLRSSAGHVPPIYGLPKLHKSGVPLRPIVSSLSSPTYILSKHLCSLLSPLVGSQRPMLGIPRILQNF